MKKSYEERSAIKKSKRKKELDDFFGDLLLATITSVLFGMFFIAFLERLVS